MLTFARDTIMRVSCGNASQVWEIPVLSGFSFSQQQDVSEITLNEASANDGTARRGRSMQVNAMQPAEFSFQTYIRPFASDGGHSAGEADDAADHHLVEEILWYLLTQANNTTGFTAASSGTGAAMPGFTFGTSSSSIGTFSNKNTVDTATIDFIMNANNTNNDVIYRLSEAVVNECTIDFDIEGIATATWSGFAQTLTEEGSGTPTASNISEGINSTNNMIRNRLSTAVITDNTTATGGTTAFNLTLTGGSWTYSNNITYLTGDELGKVNKPLVPVAGHRTVSGSFTCYLNADIGTTAANANLFEALVEDTARINPNIFDVDVYIGGTSDGSTTLSPGISIKMPTAHLQVPTHSMDDLVSLEITYDALPATVAAANEISAIAFIGPTPN